MVLKGNKKDTQFLGSPYVIDLLKTMCFSPVEFKGNPSLLDLLFPRGLRQMENFDTHTHTTGPDLVFLRMSEQVGWPLPPACGFLWPEPVLCKWFHGIWCWPRFKN